MESELTLKPIYIVISQTGTILSRILKLITHKEYNHVSLSLADDLHLMYSFGRKNPYCVFPAGFVTESASFGTFKRFSNTKVIVLKTFITQNKYDELYSFINYMVSNPTLYRYNYLGLYFAALKICHRAENRYYCSEFVRDILIKYDVKGADDLEKIVHPMSFVSLPDTERIFMGKLKDFNKKTLTFYKNMC
ncbi:MAG: hypothetical protein IJO62_04830 [Clostridia bacterium]|nr:hypothetical protein [Clostridia bacterium]